MGIKDLDSVLFLGGQRFSRALTFFGSSLTPLEEKIIPQNAIFVLPKEHFLGFSVKLALPSAFITSSSGKLCLLYVSPSAGFTPIINLVYW